MEEEINGYDLLDLENYYEALAPFTFATRFLNLSRPQAEAAVRAYDDKRLSTNNAPAQDGDILQQLADQIEEIIQDFDTKEAFVRLSTRSPKDYALRAPKTRNILAAELEGVQGDDEVGQIIALIRTTSKALKSSSGREAVEFFTNSERSYQDLSRRILSSNDESDFKMQVVIREWVDIDPELEFRGFATNKQLNALTQYYKACYVPRLAEEKNEFAEKILELYDAVKDLIQVDRYVIDFAVTKDRVYVVELNHWGKTASSSLFDWTKDHEVMHNGPFELRVVEHPFENAKSLIARPLRAMLAEFAPAWQDPEPASLSDDATKARYVPHFKALTSAYRMQRRSLEAIDLARLFSQRVVRIEKVWGGDEQYVVHWEFADTAEKEKGEDEQDSEKGGVLAVLGMSQHSIQPAYDDKIIMLRHKRFIKTAAMQGEQQEERKEKEKKKGSKLDAWKRKLGLAYDFIFAQYHVDLHGKATFNSKAEDTRVMLEDVQNCCMLLMRQFDYLERK